jgi:hypothetical protein
MKPFQQFFALLRFQAFAAPRLWIFPIAFGIQPCISLMSSDTWHGLTAAIASSGLMWMAPMMVAAFVFTPDLWTGMQGTRVQAQENVQGVSADFLLTRAFDRPMVFRARAALFWILVLFPVIVLLGLAAWKPSISIEVPLQPPSVGTAYLETLPGASVTKTTKTTETITSPAGRLAIAGVMGLFAVVLAIFCQGFVFAINGLKFKQWIFFPVFIVVPVSYPCLLIWRHGHSLENLILLILKHPLAAVALTGLGVAAAWAFSAARAKTIEYP